MRQFTEDTLTDAVIARLKDVDNPRFKQIMTSAVKHLHAFARDAALTEEEWFEGIKFLTACGQKCDDKRQEFILLSDILGLSMMSESRMNSWRLSSHFWPTAVRNLMPSNHSSSVRCTSRAKACRCFTALVMISLKRLSFVSFRRATTAAVSVSSVNWRMGFLLRMQSPSVLSKRAYATRHVHVGNSPAAHGSAVRGRSQGARPAGRLWAHLPRRLA